MQFPCMGTTTLLKGVGTTDLSLEEGSHFLKSDKSANKGFLLKITSCDAEGSTLFHHPAIQSILHSLNSVFAKPTSLPPPRAQDHWITLHTNQPVNVRAYRYPYFQKTEIEKLVQEMLLSGVIRPSQSPFSAPCAFS